MWKKGIRIGDNGSGEGKHDHAGGDAHDDGNGGSSSSSSRKGDFEKVEVRRINFETLQTSLPEAQMRGKQVRALPCWDSY